MGTGRALARGMRRLRRERGMTQAELAEAVDRHEQFISQIERERRSPGIETIDAVSRALGVEPWELLRAGASEHEPRRKRDVFLDHLRAAIETWPEAKREHVVRILADLARLGSSTRPATRRRRG